MNFTTKELESQIAFLKSVIIQTEYKAEHMNQELQDLHLRLENLQIDLASREDEDSLHYNGGE